MRMWMIAPHLLCRKHLLGEHNELHMLAGSILRGKNLEGFVRHGLLQVQSLEERHVELAQEMQTRGYRHASPLPAYKNFLKNYPQHILQARVDTCLSLQELARRCPACAQRQKEYGLQENIDCRASCR